jgi:hypothetical protein
MSIVYPNPERVADGFLFDRNNKQPHGKVREQIRNSAFYDPCILTTGYGSGQMLECHYDTNTNRMHIPSQEGGSNFSAYAYYHDLAHCLDFIHNDEIWRLFDFQFYETKEINVRTHLAGTNRELRTFAIQFCMALYDGIITESELAQYVDRACAGIAGMYDERHISAFVEERQKWRVENLYQYLAQYQAERDFVAEFKHFVHLIKNGLQP